MKTSPAALKTKTVSLSESLATVDPGLQVFLNSISDIVALIDPQGRLIFANENMARRMGMSLDKLIGACLWDFFPPDVAKYRKDVTEQVIRTHQPVRIEEQTPDKIYDSIVSPIFDAQGSISQMAVLARDITESKQAEEALRLSQQRLQMVINNAPIALFAIDQQGQITFAKGQIFELLGVRPEEYVGQNIFKVMHMRTDILESVREALQGREINERIHTRAHHTFETHYSPVQDEGGNFVGVTGILIDVTERQRAEEELRKAHADLEVRIQERTVELAQAVQELRTEINTRQKVETALQSNVARAEALARVAVRLNARLDLQTVLHAVCEETARVIGYPICSVMLVDEKRDGFYVAAATGPHIEARQASPPLPRALYEPYRQAFGEVIIIPDVRSLPNVHDPDLVAMMNTRTAISVPLIHDQQMIGALNVSSHDKVRLPSDEDLAFLQAIASQAAVAIANARLFEQASTDRQRLESLSQKLVEIQEVERHNLARELHDEIGQLLTSLNLKLGMAARGAASINANDPTQSAIILAQKLVGQLLKQVRELSLDLRPALLDDLGLLPALLSHFDRYTDQTGIQVDFKHSGIERRFKTQIETAAFRIIQEALTNTARHTKVDRVMVRLRADQKALELQIEDYGIGFEVQATLERGTSVGLSGMRERARLCGGRLEIESEPGFGTCLTAEFPLNSLERKADADFDPVS